MKIQIFVNQIQPLCIKLMINQIYMRYKQITLKDKSVRGLFTHKKNTNVLKYLRT